LDAQHIQVQDGTVQQSSVLLLLPDTQFQLLALQNVQASCIDSMLEQVD
jgi:hypothetical protein